MPHTWITLRFILCIQDSNAIEGRSLKHSLAKQQLCIVYVLLKIYPVTGTELALSPRSSLRSDVIYCFQLKLENKFAVNTCLKQCS